MPGELCFCTTQRTLKWLGGSVRLKYNQRSASEQFVWQSA